MFEWSRPYSGWLYVALAVGIAVLIVVARKTAISARLRSWLLFVPRLIVFFAARGSAAQSRLDARAAVAVGTGAGSFSG